MEVISDLMTCLHMYANSGYATFPTTTNKTPFIPKGTSWKDYDIDVFIDVNKYPQDSFGVVLKKDDLVVDLDPRNMEGRRVWTELKRSLGISDDAEKTMTVQTGGGGLHFYLKKPTDIDVKKTLKGFPGIEFLSEGAYVIGGGSLHHSGKRYQIVDNAFHIKETPQQLLDALRKDLAIENTTIAPKPTPTFRVGEDNTKRFIEYLQYDAEPAVEGRNGDLTTYKIACVGRDFNLPVEKCYELMSIHYNQRCVPKWPERDLLLKVQNAYVYADKEPGSQDPVIVLPNIEDIPSLDNEMGWVNNLDRSKHGIVKNTLSNAVYILKHDKGLRKRFSLNLFTNQMVLTGDVPWEKNRVNVFREVTDTEVGHISLHIAHEYGVEVSIDRMWRALQIVSSYQSYHPVRDELDEIKWDGVKRVDTWLIDYCGVEDSPYSREVGKRTLIGAISRIYNPGVKFDYVLILEGAQGIGKSTICALIGDKWYGDMPIDVTAKDTIEYVRSHWIIELSELVTLKKADADRLKNFLSRTEDTARPAYARAQQRFPRQCIFIGTVNPDNSGYLLDRTGNRRFWPVLCTEIDMDGFKRDRDQILAEARELFLAGEPNYITGTLIKSAEKEANSRLIKDPWIDIIERWCMANKDMTTEVTTEEIYQNVLGGSYTSINTYHQRRIAGALQNAGWYKHRTATGIVYLSSEEQKYKDNGDTDVNTITQQ